jgi:hypothetical protein
LFGSPGAGIVVAGRLFPAGATPTAPGGERADGYVDADDWPYAHVAACLDAYADLYSVAAYGDTNADLYAGPDRDTGGVLRWQRGARPAAAEP